MAKKLQDPPATTTINCSRCGKMVSSPVPAGTIVRAFIECPECVEKQGEPKPGKQWGDHKVTVNPLKPSLALLVKIGSAVVHADEFMGPTGHPLDKTAFDDLMRNAELQTWLSDLTEKGYLPVRR